MTMNLPSVTMQLSSVTMSPPFVTVMLCINSVLEVDTFTVLLCRKNGLFLFIALQRMDAFCKKVLSGFRFGR